MRFRSLAAVPLLALVGTFMVLVQAGPATAAACSGTSGVTVVVQFPDRTETRCAAGDPSSGWDALERAGFSVTPVSAFPGAVCRIDNVPTSDQDPCVRMPPASRYWAYFHAKRGGTWASSNEGARTYDPAPGTVEGWRLGAGEAPSSPPPAATPKPTKPSAAPSARPTSGVAAGSVGSGSGGSGSAGAGSGSADGASAADAATDPADSPRGDGAASGSSSSPPSPTSSDGASDAASEADGVSSASATASPSADADQALTSVAAQPRESSSNTGAIVGVGLILALALGGGVMAWRRRSAEGQLR